MKTFLLFLGDVIALYIALLITVAIRYGGSFYHEFINRHAGPFTIIFIPWIIIFFIAGLYDLKRLRNNLDFYKTLALALVINALIAVLIFYLVPAFGITPKTNLLIFIIIFAIIEIIWRRAWNFGTASGEAPNRAILIGSGATAREIELTIAENPQMGYSIVRHMEETEIGSSPDALRDAANDSDANLIAIPREMKYAAQAHSGISDPRGKSAGQSSPISLSKTLYGLFGKGVAIMDLDRFYEIIMRKVPLADLEETWFLENIEAAGKFYDGLKRAAEFIFAAVIGVVLSPIELLIALGVALTSRGPIFIRQTRVGESGKIFTLYKFRSMVALSPDGLAETEETGAQWSSGKNDKRITGFGRLIRRTHLDELPQLWNILRGDTSFVGPRPERPEFVEKLKGQVPFYEVRLLIKPGVTGWAQINHPADTGLDDVRQKLQYDIYYLKNRSPVLDVAIILKTLKSLFVNPERAKKI